MVAESLEQEFEDSIFNGILFAVMDDSGPSLRINASSLDDREAIATAIQGITAVGMGEDDIEGLFGPLPVPYNVSYQALVYIFNVEPITTTDIEVYEKGRFCALFIIFRKEMFHLIANVFSMIESLLKVYQENYLQTEENLEIKTIQLIYEDIVNKLKIKPRVRVFKIEDGITVEFEEKKALLSGDLTVVVHEKEKKIYYYHLKNLEESVKEKTTKIMNYINRTEYQNSFTTKKLSSKKKLQALLEKAQITIIE